MKIFEVCIGLEVHAQIISKTKLFSAARISNSINSPPNIFVASYDAAYPGVLPNLSKSSVRQAVTAALALKCQINKKSIFERKHYRYPDLPLGYQITQQLLPIAFDGMLNFDYTVGDEFLSRGVQIERIQIEQDSGKSIHNQHDALSLIDLNRSGSCLLEIVFAPTLTEACQAVAAVKSLQHLFRHINVCDGCMESGSLRCDVNVSLKWREEGSEMGQNKVHSGSRVEIKNLNSLVKIEDAITFEVNRQASLINKNELVMFETRGYDPDNKTTYYMRSKESSVDYRFLPDPDLPALVLNDDDIFDIQANFPELPHETVGRLKSAHGLTTYQTDILLSEYGLLRYYEDILGYSDAKGKGGDSGKISPLDPHLAFNWLATELLGILRSRGISISTSPVSAIQLAKTLRLLVDGGISAPQGKALLRLLVDEELERCGRPACAASGPAAVTALDPEEIVRRQGWLLVHDPVVIEKLCLDVVYDEKNAKQLSAYKKGKRNLEKFFFGEVMKRGNGQIEPHVLQDCLTSVLKSL